MEEGLRKSDQFSVKNQSIQLSIRSPGFAWIRGFFCCRVNQGEMVIPHLESRFSNNFPI